MAKFKHENQVYHFWDSHIEYLRCYKVTKVDLNFAVCRRYMYMPSCRSIHPYYWMDVLIAESDMHTYIGTLWMILSYLYENRMCFIHGRVCCVNSCLATGLGVGGQQCISMWIQSAYTVKLQNKPSGVLLWSLHMAWEKIVHTERPNRETCTPELLLFVTLTNPVSEANKGWCMGQTVLTLLGLLDLRYVWLM